jgi:hypothetical protein
MVMNIIGETRGIDKGGGDHQVPGTIRGKGIKKRAQILEGGFHGFTITPGQ